LPAVTGVAIRYYEDLDCWKLSNELKQRVYELIDTSEAKRHLRFCNQLKKSASSAPANIAEGFAVYEHGESIRYARVAKGSLTETHNHLQAGVDRRLWTREQSEPFRILAKRAIGATAGWIRSLSTRDAPPPRWANEVSEARRKKRRRT